MALEPVAQAPGRNPRTSDFVRLKLRLLRNSFRGQAVRVVVFVLGTLAGALFAFSAALGMTFSGLGSRDVGFIVATFAGTAVVLGWTVVPLLFFGVDETLDPARFALLPIQRMILARGMLAAALVGVPAVATLVATSGLVIAASIRFGVLGGLVGFVGIVGGLILGVIASRALTSAFAALLRSRRVRDLAAVLIALLASSVAPLQWAISAALQRGSMSTAVRVADILSWTPFGAPYALVFDVNEHRWLAALARLAMTAASIGLLLWWWSHTIESAMLGASTGSGAKVPNRSAAAATGGAVASLIAQPLRRLAGTGVFGAILAREFRFWWRDPRRRASLLSILIASAVVPIALNLASGDSGSSASAARRAAATGLSSGSFTFAVTMSGIMGGMLLANQFAYDGSAFAAHLLARVPGRTELRARAGAIALVAIPVQLIVVVVVTILAGSFAQLPTGLGLLAASFGASVAGAGLLSVLAPYALPENSNPFAMNSGGGSAKGILAIVAVLATGIISGPVVVASLLLSDRSYGPSLVLGIGVVYGLGIAWVGTLAAGAIVDKRGPEILVAVTPRR